MKKAYLLILITIAGFTWGLSSCRFGCVKGSGHVVSEVRKLNDFSKIDISGLFKIILKQDSTLNLSVSADDNLIKYIKTNVSGNKLHISTGNKNICNVGEMVITIGVHDLEAIKSSGAVEISTDGKLVTKNLHFDLSGIAKVNMELNAANVSTEGSGATDVTLRGQASSHNINLSGGGKIHAFDFVVGNYNIESSGASECEINVLHELNVKSSGASSIKYKGNPASVNNNKSGVSSITKVE
ncbi:head GIN domain-containing protein [Mucilaginibacter sp.]|uniref:head GIN domain-containing protein n=1 Tax=Mucilaginibacter sp. TaxID=1882438 RepID=UPI0026285B92|nr:head GIN domain-containing protein [Mucilaginibacter sp.]MDB5032441.1 hypothetical protein [Mucilaginibacter sp.]